MSEPFFKAEDFPEDELHEGVWCSASGYDYARRANAKVQPLLDRLASAEEALEFYKGATTYMVSADANFQDIMDPSTRARAHFEKWKKL